MQYRKSLLAALSVVIAVPLVAVPLEGLRRYLREQDLLQFSSTSRRDPRPITTENIAQLQRLWKVKINGGVSDSSPLYVNNIQTKDGFKDLVILSLTNGGLVALSSRDGSVLWQTTPPAGQRWTTASPAVDPNRQYVYAYATDGYVHRYDINDGKEVTGDGWPELITRKGDVEKGSSSITIATARDGNTYLYMTVAGYPDPGDAGDYQGHLTTINLSTGEQHTFNALCSDRDMHFLSSGDPTTDCDQVQAGIWARAGAVYDPVTDRVFVTTGNGTYDAASGGFNWGDSIIALRPNGTTDGGTPLDSYTPAEYQMLDDLDYDLGSSTVAPLPVAADSPFRHLAVQAGKDWKIRMVDLSDLSGQSGPRHIGGELATISLPQLGELMTRPATWYNPSTKTTWVFFVNYEGASAMQLAADDDGKPTLTTVWKRSEGGATPVLANGILYYARDGEIDAVNATTGDLLWHDTSIGPIHWESPIVTNGCVYIADTDGYVTAYTILQLGT
jgi:outer membrane protein assembly factor BamB